MAEADKKQSDETPAPAEAEELEEQDDVEDRKRDYSKLKKVAEQLDELYTSVVQAFDDKEEQSEDIEEYWDIYNCTLNENQAYFGNSQIYVSAVADATDALTTRYNNMLFPINGRNSDATGPQGTKPYELLALLDHYVRLTEMRQNVIPSLLRTGKITGHYLLMPGWKKYKRHTVQKTKTALVESELGTPVEGTEEVDDVKEQTIEVGMPTLEVKDPRDVAVLPATVDKLDDATVVAIRIQFSKKAVQDNIDDGTFEEEAGKMLLDNFEQTPTSNETDTTKQSLNEAGVRKSGKEAKTATIYMVWSWLKLRGKEKRLCLSYHAGAKLHLSCKRNPYWNDKIALLAQPARKLAGSFWGKSVYKKVARVQYGLNDTVNMGMDSSQYSLCPITVSDPAKNPRTGTMVVTMGALWEADPNSTRFMEFPQLWESALKQAGALSDRIMQSMGINPALLPHGNAGKKPSQAQVSQEQQTAQESTGDEVSIIEEGILGPLLGWFHDLDYQFREEAITVKQFGQLGQQAKMLEVPPLETYTAYTFRWYGTEGTRAIQQVQQMIAVMNVFRAVPPDQLNGRKVDIGPVLEQIAETAFGPRIAPYVLIDVREQLSVAPEEENTMMQSGFPVSVQMLDDDVAHLKVHMPAFQQNPLDEHFKLHILAHVNQLNQKSQAANPAAKGQQGSPGGAGPGMPGQPRIGAQPGPPKPVQAPPGTIHQDQMDDPNRMPR